MHAWGWFWAHSDERKKRPGVQVLGQGLQNWVSEVVAPVQRLVWSRICLEGHALTQFLHPSS